MRPRFLSRHRSPSLVAALLVASACASTGDFGQLGTFDAHAPTVAMVQGEERPTNLDITLGTPGYVVVLFVLPARGATVIYPGDSTRAENNYFTTGTHRITTTFTDRDKLIDTTFLVRRAGDTVRTRRQEPRARRIVPSEIERQGYLLLIASQDTLDAAKIRSRLDGVTIPMEDAEALNAVSKLVVQTTRRDRPWSGYYRAVVVK